MKTQQNASIHTELPVAHELGERMEFVLCNDVAFHGYHTYERITFMPGFICATVREVEDPTDEYDTIEDVPQSVWDAMDYVPQFYSMRIGTTPVIVDYNGTVLIPETYSKQVSRLRGEYRIRRAHAY